MKMMNPIMTKTAKARATMRIRRSLLLPGKIRGERGEMRGNGKLELIMMKYVLGDLSGEKRKCFFFGKFSVILILTRGDLSRILSPDVDCVGAVAKGITRNTDVLSSISIS